MAQGRGETLKRIINIDVDSLLRIFKDYAGEGAIPFDAMPDALRYDPKMQRFELRVGGNWAGDKGRVFVDFQVKRFTPVGGQSE